MQQLRVDTAALQAMASRWGASVGELSETAAPAGLGLSCQASAGAVSAAHADVTAFTAAQLTSPKLTVAISPMKLTRPPRWPR